MEREALHISETPYPQHLLNLRIGSKYVRELRSYKLSKINVANIESSLAGKENTKYKDVHAPKSNATSAVGLIG